MGAVPRLGERLRETLRFADNACSNGIKIDHEEHEDGLMALATGARTRRPL